MHLSIHRIGVLRPFDDFASGSVLKILGFLLLPIREKFLLSTVESKKSLAYTR